MSEIFILIVFLSLADLFRVQNGALVCFFQGAYPRQLIRAGEELDHCEEEGTHQFRFPQFSSPRA